MRINWFSLSNINDEEKRTLTIRLFGTRGDRTDFRLIDRRLLGILQQMHIGTISSHWVFFVCSFLVRLFYLLIKAKDKMEKIILRNLFVLISAAIFLGTIILNLLAIVYISSKRDRTSIAILVVNLAIVDIIHASKFKAKRRKSKNVSFSVGIIFFSSNLFTPNWVFGEFGCKFSLTIDVLCTVVS